MLLSLGGHSYEIVKTHLQHLFTAVAINLVRFDAWHNDIPHAKARTSRFAALALASSE
jgi:transposase